MSKMNTYRLIENGKKRVVTVNDNSEVETKNMWKSLKISYERVEDLDEREDEGLESQEELDNPVKWEMRALLVISAMEGLGEEPSEVVKVMSNGKEKSFTKKQLYRRLARKNAKGTLGFVVKSSKVKEDKENKPDNAEKPNAGDKPKSNNGIGNGKVKGKDAQGVKAKVNKGN